MRMRIYICLGRAHYYWNVLSFPPVQGGLCLAIRGWLHTGRVRSDFFWTQQTLKIFTTIITIMCVQKILQDNKQGLWLYHRIKCLHDILLWFLLTNILCPPTCWHGTDAWIEVPGQWDGIWYLKSGVLSFFSFSHESGLEEKLLCIRPVKGGETSHCHFLTLSFDQML